MEKIITVVLPSSTVPLGTLEFTQVPEIFSYVHVCFNLAFSFVFTLHVSTLYPVTNFFFHYTFWSPTFFCKAFKRKVLDHVCSCIGLAKEDKNKIILPQWDYQENLPFHHLYIVMSYCIRPSVVDLVYICGWFCELVVLEIERAQTKILYLYYVK